MNNLKEGKGLYIYADGDEYNGDWKNDLQNGKGIYKFKDGESYDGEYLDGERTGQGIFRYKNGDQYSGHFLKGQSRVMVRCHGEMVTSTLATGREICRTDKAN